MDDIHDVKVAPELASEAGNEAADVAALDENIRQRALRAIQRRGKMTMSVLSAIAVPVALAIATFGQQID